ncbi:MAG: isocitrate/isopropylmalate dehydrogenase family protein [Pseudomonadota bacterium]
MALRLLCLDGDGIGPEIAAATRRVVQAACDQAGCAIAFEQADIGFAALETTGTTFPDSVLEAAKAADGVILGPVSHNAYPPREEGGVNPSGKLRIGLDLYANIRPARSHPAVPTPTGAKVDLVVMRENTEGFYADRNMASGPAEIMVSDGVAVAMRRITRHCSARIAEAGFRLAVEQGRGRVTAIHKANVMRLSDGLFLEETRAAAARYPDIAYDEMLVDAAAAHLVRDPGRFGVLIATNMFGDILSDLASELSGGLGLAASLNRGDAHAVAQAQHGSAPDIAGQGVANPASLIASAAMLLAHLGQGRAADLITAGLDSALTRADTRTRDLGGSAGTDAMTDAIIEAITATSLPATSLPATPLPATDGARA